ncbi:MAG: phosphate ABC transporter permease subunit PstC [Sphingomonadaceae bacterium]
MTPGFLFLAAALLATFAYVFGRARGTAFEAARAGIGEVHSRPSYHGAWVALMGALPAFLFLTFWAIFGERFVADAVLASLPDRGGFDSDLARTAFLTEVEELAEGTRATVFDPRSPAAAEIWQTATARYNWLATAATLALFLMGALWAASQLRPGFRARNRVDAIVIGLLVIASLIAILTTFGIVLSLIFESFRFFQMVSPIEFLFGTNWSPQTAIRADQVGSTGAFGAVPLFWGTIFIGAIIAMIVAIPLGLMSAIYLTQYAAPGFRRWAKPILEVLAGVPTVVYGFFAALTVAPLVRQLGISLGIADASAESALAAGLVMGIMIIPFVSSMADDALAAVPAAMRDGSLAMGATTSETIARVLIPAALPGIVGGVLLAVSRAIGETMIVVMAAGLAANLTANPFKSVTTVTAQIVALLTGDQEFDSAKTLSAFALGMVLFLVTLALNVYALAVVKRYREAYE